MNAKDEIKARERKVDVNSMSKEQVDVLMEQIGAKVSKEFSDLYTRLNSMLKIYGLDVTLHYVIHPEGETASEFISGTGVDPESESN